VCSSDSPIYINTNPPEDDLIRANTYLMSRRLWLMRGPANPTLDTLPTTPAADVLNDLAVTTKAYKCVGPGGTAGNLCTGGGADQLAEETKLFKYITDKAKNGTPGRCNTWQAVTDLGFTPCNGPTITNCVDALNPAELCAAGPYEYPKGAPGACLPSGSSVAAVTGTCSVTTTTSCTANSDCPSGETCSGHPAYTAAWNGALLWSSVTVTATDVCCSTGKVPGTSLVCDPANTNRPLNSACSKAGTTAAPNQAECATGLVCKNIGGGNLACK
jgi:hypothetical protein